jgi:hypothetical protein
MTGYRELTKAQRRILRDLAGLAYERELGAELTLLESSFAAWRAGLIDAFELEGRIHRFHQGPARKLFTKYDDTDPLLAVAAARSSGLIAETEVPEAVRPALAPMLAFIRDRNDPQE